MITNGNPFNLGLKLEGQDAINFHEYLENPTCTPEGIELLRQAKELADAQENEIPQWLKDRINLFMKNISEDEAITALKWVISQKKDKLPIFAQQFLPCPFCGFKDLSCDGHFVQCNTCGARGPDFYPLQNREDVINRWNTRVEPSEIPEWLKKKLNDTIINCRLLEEELRDPGTDTYDIEEAVRVSRRANTLEWVLSLKKDE